MGINDYRIEVVTTLSDSEICSIADEVMLAKPPRFGPEGWRAKFAWRASPPEPGVLRAYRLQSAGAAAEMLAAKTVRVRNSLLEIWTEEAGGRRTVTVAGASPAVNFGVNMGFAVFPRYLSLFGQRLGSGEPDSGEVGPNSQADRGDGAQQFASEFFGQQAFSDSERTQPISLGSLAPGGRAWLRVQLRNTGHDPWIRGTVNLGTSNPTERSSMVRTASWIGPTRACTLAEERVDPGDVGTFDFDVSFGCPPGHREHFAPVWEGVAWDEHDRIHFQFGRPGAMMNALRRVSPFIGNHADDVFGPGHGLDEAAEVVREAFVDPAGVRSLHIKACERHQMLLREGVTFDDWDRVTGFRADNFVRAGINRGEADRLINGFAALKSLTALLTGSNRSIAARVGADADLRALWERDDGFAVRSLAWHLVVLARLVAHGGVQEERVARCRYLPASSLGDPPRVEVVPPPSSGDPDLDNLHLGRLLVELMPEGGAELTPQEIPRVVERWKDYLASQRVTLIWAEFLAFPDATSPKGASSAERFWFFALPALSAARLGYAPHPRAASCVAMAREALDRSDPAEVAAMREIDVTFES